MYVARGSCAPWGVSQSYAHALTHAFTGSAPFARLTTDWERLQVFDEANSPFTSANQAMYAANAPSGGLNSNDFGEFLQKRAINGKIYCALTGLDAAVGDRVQWHIATLVSRICSAPQHEANGPELTACRATVSGCCGEHIGSGPALWQRDRQRGRGHGLRGSHSPCVITLQRSCSCSAILGRQGNEIDVHAAHFHGHTLAESGRNLDSFKLIPSVVRTTTLVPDNPGVWLYHCHVRPPTPAPILHTQRWLIWCFV